MDKQKDRPFLEATLETSEAVIDALTDDKMLAEIPVIGTAIKVCKAIDDLRNRAFIAKLARFVSTLSTVQEVVKQKWRERVVESPEEAQKVGETLFFILERFTDFDKPILLSQLFLAYVDGHISSQELRRLAQAIDSCFSDDLKQLLDTHRLPQRSDASWMRYLSAAGLTQIAAGQTWDESGNYYEVSPLGHKLRNAYLHGRRFTINSSFSRKATDQGVD